MNDELKPLPDGFRNALARCRFVTPNVSHTVAWAWTDDEETAKLLGGGTRYRRSSEPEKHEWECTITHPDGVALACELAEVGHGRG